MRPLIEVHTRAWGGRCTAQVDLLPSDNIHRGIFKRRTCVESCMSLSLCVSGVPTRLTLAYSLSSFQAGQRPLVTAAKVECGQWTTLAKFLKREKRITTGFRKYKGLGHLAQKLA